MQETTDQFCSELIQTLVWNCVSSARPKRPVEFGAAVQVAIVLANVLFSQSRQVQQFPLFPACRISKAEISLVVQLLLYPRPKCCWAFTQTEIVTRKLPAFGKKIP